MSKLYEANDLIKLLNKLEKKVEDLYCFAKECCAKIPVNVGTGIGLFKKFNQNKWEFKSLLPGNNINITQTNNEVIISSTTEPIDCQDIKDCLGISNLGDPDKYLNEQGTWQAIDLTGTPTEILYYDNSGNIVSDANFYRVTTGGIPNTYIKSIDNNSGGYSEIYAGSNYLALYNDLSGSGDGGYLYLQNTARLGKITANNFSSYLEVDSTNFIYRNTSTGVIFVYPNVDGLNGHVLTTNGAGDLTFQPIPSTPQYITAIADTNTVDLTETAGTLTADINYQNTATINLSEDASGLKADLATGAAVTNLGYTPENVANKTTTIAGNESSTTLYANVKGLVDWVKQGMTALLSSLGLTKTTPVDADSLLLNDSADSNKLKLLSWANLKATLKTYFDTLYNGQINPITQFSAFTHFTEIFPGIGAGTTGAGVWELGNGWVLARGSGGASATVLPAEAGRPGIVRHSTGAINSYNQIRCGEVWVSSAPLVFKGHFRIQTLSGGGQTFVIICGFQTGGTLVVPPTDAIRILLTDANVLQVEVIKSSVSLVVNTGITVAIDTHYDIVITKADTTNECQFYVNGVNVYSLTNAADIATYVPQNLSMVCNNSFQKTGGSNARTFDTDFAYVTNNLPI